MLLKIRDTLSYSFISGSCFIKTENDTIVQLLTLNSKAIITESYRTSKVIGVK